MLQVTNIQVSGFRSVNDKSPVSLALNPGAFLVEGMNGAGKTTIACEALYWLLFGKSLRGSTVATVVNRDSPEAIVVADFIREDGMKVKVTRRRTRAGNKHTFSMVDSNGNDLLAASGVGTTVTARGDVVCQLLKLTADIVKATAFYSPTDSLLALGDTERRKLLEGLLDVDWVDSAREATKTKIAEVRAAQDELGKKIAYASGSVNVLKSEAARLRSDAMGLAAKVLVGADAIKKVMQDIVNRRALLSDHIQAQQAAVVSITQEKEVASVDAARYNAAVNSFNQEKSALSAKVSGYNMVITTQQRALTKATADIERMRSTTICPTCAQSLPENYYKDAMDKALAVEAEARKSLEANDALRGGLQAEMDAVAQKLHDATDEFNAASHRVVEANQRINVANNAAMNAGREIAQLDVEYTRKEAELLAIDNLDAAKAKLESDAQAKDSQSEAMIATIEEHTHTRDHTLAERLGVLNWWHTAFGPKGIRAFALEGLVFDLTRRANEYLRFLSDGRLTLEASTTKQTTSGNVSETLDFRVLNALGIDSYADASTGERRLADIALTVALYDTTSDLSGVGGLGYMVFDEALDSLDASYAQAVVDLFSRLGERGICIGTISHSEEVQGNFPVSWCVGRNDSGWTHVVVYAKEVGRQLASSGVLDEVEGNEGRMIPMPAKKSDIPEVYAKYGCDEAITRLHTLISQYPPGVPAEFTDKDVLRVREIVDKALNSYRLTKGLDDAAAVYRLFTGRDSSDLSNCHPLELLAVAYRLGACCN